MWVAVKRESAIKVWVAGVRGWVYATCTPGRGERKGEQEMPETDHPRFTFFSSEQISC